MLCHVTLRIAPPTPDAGRRSAGTRARRSGRRRSTLDALAAVAGSTRRLEQVVERAAPLAESAQPGPGVGDRDGRAVEQLVVAAPTIDSTGPGVTARRSLEADGDASIAPGRSSISTISTSMPPSAPASSAIEPCAISRPSSSATTWSQTRSTSSRTCDDEHHVDPEVAFDLHDDVEHLVALHRVEAVGRLVEHDEARVGGDRLGELDPLALPGRHRAERAEPLFAEPDQVQRVARPAAGLVAWESLHLGEVADEVVGPHVVREHVALRAVSDLGAQLGTLPSGVEAEHADRPGRRVEQTETERDQRRLPGAVRPDQPGHTGWNRHVEPVERPRRRELHDETGRLDDRGHDFDSATARPPAGRPRG